MRLAFCLSNHFCDDSKRQEFNNIILETAHRGYRIDLFVIEPFEGIPPGINIITVPAKGMNLVRRKNHFKHYIQNIIKNTNYDLVVNFNNNLVADVYVFTEAHINHITVTDDIINKLEKIIQRKLPDLITMQDGHRYTGNKIKLESNLLSCWPQQNRFTAIMQTSGTVYRAIENRKTIKFKHNQHHYFIKLHFGSGWLEIAKNLLFGRLPIIGAKNEYQALNQLRVLGIQAPLIAGYGESGFNPAKKQSFMITHEVANVKSLDEFAGQWRSRQLSWAIKQQLIKQIATIIATLHQNGINHRDLYACHFMISDPISSSVNITLMDLHRAQIRKKTPLRWMTKDLASLYYSILEFNVTKRDLLRFMQYYTNQIWRNEINNVFWQAVQQRSKKFIKRHHKFFTTPLELK